MERPRPPSFIASGENDIRYIKAAANFDEKSFLKAAKLPANSYQIAKAYPKIRISNQGLNLFKYFYILLSDNETRNAWAHDTERASAELFVKKEDINLYHAWGPIFKYYYGTSIKKILKSFKTNDSRLKEFFLTRQSGVG